METPQAPREGNKVVALIEGIDAVLADMGVAPPEPTAHTQSEVYSGSAARARRILGTERLGKQVRDAMGLPSPRRAHGEVEIVRPNEF